jgi:hypothetical protein
MATTVVYPDIYFEFMHRKTGQYECYTHAEFLNDYIPMDVCAIIIEALCYREQLVIMLDLLPLNVRSIYFNVRNDTSAHTLSFNINDNLPPNLKDYVNSTWRNIPVMHMRNMPHYLELLYSERPI